MLVWISENCCSGALQPAAVVDPFFGISLATGNGLGIPDRIEGHKDDPNFMLLGNA